MYTDIRRCVSRGTAPIASANGNSLGPGYASTGHAVLGSGMYAVNFSVSCENLRGFRRRRVPGIAILRLSSREYDRVDLSIPRGRRPGKMAFLGRD